MYSFKLLTTEQSNKTNFNSIKSVFTFIEKKKNRIEKFQIFSCIYRKLICELICNKESGWDIRVEHPVIFFLHKQVHFVDKPAIIIKERINYAGETFLTSYLQDFL